MNENEKDQELEIQDLDLDDIMKEFSPAEGEDPEAELEALEEEMRVPETPEETEPEDTGEDDDDDIDDGDEDEDVRLAGSDTVRVELPKKQSFEGNMGDTIRLENVEELAREAARQNAQQQKAEPFSEQWEPEYEQPIAEYVPVQPIVFHPRAKLRELKRKLVAGPERRYYEINEIGFGKLQAAIFLSILVVALSAGATVLNAMGMMQAERLKLMVFGQFIAMMVSALLGCYQMMDGISDLFRGRFSLNTLLVFTFAACCVDGVFCLQEQRIPCCAAFSLQVTMSLWGTYHRRNAEMAMMDTLRKANHLGGVKAEPDYYDGCDGLLREEGQVEDFMDHYSKPSAPEKVFSWYAVIALLVSIGAGVTAGVLHNSVPFGVQVLSVSLLAAVPVTSFITLSRPMAILERRLHKLGAVICGWRGIQGLSKRAVFPVEHDDLFPVGACKLNGVKFYSDRDPDEVVAYCAALVNANGGGLVPLFEYLLNSRNGRHYEVESLRPYKGGIGAEVCGEPVLMGTLTCLKEMGVEIPEGTRVNQAVYAAIDGELCGVFAVTYAKVRSSVAGLRTLCGYRGLRPVLTTGDFMLTEEFIRSRFNVNTRRICFPERAARAELARKTAEADVPALAIITTEGLAPYAYAVTGARSVRTACWIGTVIHLLGGVVGLAMMVILAVLGAGELLTPMNLFLYELVWIIPGLLFTEWTRAL